MGSFGVQRKNGRENVTFEGGKSLDINNDIADEINGAKHLNILYARFKTYSGTTKSNTIYIEKSGWIRAKCSGCCMIIIR
jgi:hypothetical protein